MEVLLEPINKSLIIRACLTIILLHLSFGIMRSFRHFQSRHVAELPIFRGGHLLYHCMSIYVPFSDSETCLNQ